MTTEAAPPDRACHDTAHPDGDSSGRERTPRSARWLVVVVLAALVIPGLAGLEAWPLTGWKLFSLVRDDSQTVWALEAVDADGATRDVSLEDLPLGYRHADWPLSDLLGASTARREQVCDALLGAVVDVHPDTTELRLRRDHQQLVPVDGDWEITHDPEVFHTCRV